MQAKVLKRIYKEIEDVNNDFFSLRTTITPDHDYYVQRFTFIMLPNDGPLAHLPLLGAFYIPDTYPESPPVVHLFTKTKRHCVDKFHHHAKRNMKSHSSLCFNILRSAEPDGHGSGTWTSECTLSALFAALMSAVVSFYVPREYGTDTAQPISMDGLRVIKDHVRKACEEHKEILPALMPRLPLVSAARVRANEVCFPAEIVADADKTETVTAGPIYLQTGEKDDMYTFAVDLSEVHDKMVFSVILTNTLDDLTGRKPETVLVRNGVTATAARKRTGQEAQWFYHGKPMNDGDMRLHVTIGADQMTMAYYGDDGHRYILGDCPVSRLTHNEIGDVRGVPFWIQIYTKNRAKTPTKIYTLDTCGVGYLFRDAEDREFDFVDDPEQEEPLRRKSAAQETQGTEAGSGIAQESKASGQLSLLVISSLLLIALVVPYVLLH